jgi:hypothetical protein
MSMPNIPDISLEKDFFLNKEYGSVEENLQSFFKSLSKEKAALSKLIRLEGDKIKLAVDNFDLFYTQAPDDIQTLIQSVKRINDLIIMKEWLLKQKIQNSQMLEKKLSGKDL